MFPLPMMTQAVQATDGPFLTPFDIATAVTVTSSVDLSTIGGDTSTFQQLAGIDTVNKKFWLARTAAPTDRVYIFSYTDLSDLSTGVTYDGSFDMSGISGFTDRAGPTWFTADGSRMYVFGVAQVSFFTLSTPYVFTSGATFVDAITPAGLAANSNLSYTQFVGAGMFEDVLYLNTRIGGTGTNFPLVTADVPGTGELSAVAANETFNGSSWVPDPTYQYSASRYGVCSQLDGTMYVNNTTPSPDEMIGIAAFLILPDTIQLSAPLGGTFAVTPGGGAVLTYNNTNRVVSVLGNLA